jgi:hypothetical protein
MMPSMQGQINKRENSKKQIHKSRVNEELFDGCRNG